jgi:undecaprenyl-diphosphatase
VYTNPFDASIIHFVNSFAHRSWFVDAFIVLFTSNDLLKGAPLACLFWWVWVRRDEATSERREILLFGLVACGVSVMFTRLMTLALPFRIRPLHNPSLHFHAPYTVDPEILMDWSSFPSDHTVLYVCLGATIWLVDRRLGVLAVLYAIIFTGGSRIYAGYHYPTDILVAVAVGFGFAMLARIERVRKAVAGPGMRWLEIGRSSFYACMFLWTFGIAEAFGSSYVILRYLVKLSKSR